MSYATVTYINKMSRWSVLLFLVSLIVRVNLYINGTYLS